MALISRLRLATVRFIARRLMPVTSMALVMASPAFAHDGHGNTPWHAVLHMLEGSGGALLFALVLMIGLLIVRARIVRGRSNPSSATRPGRVSAVSVANQGDDDDSR